jgi:hypothetical protein
MQEPETSGREQKKFDRAADPQRMCPRMKMQSRNRDRGEIA